MNTYGREKALRYRCRGRWTCHDAFTFDLEIGKRVYEEMVLSAGAEILYYSRAHKADMDGNRVKGLWLTSKDSMVYVSCKTIIDCSGDADMVVSTSAAQLTELSIWGRQRAKFLTEEIFRKYIPGAQNCRLRLTATHPGIRETRRIVAEYILTEEDLVLGRTFDDTVALAGRHFDLQRSVDNIMRSGGAQGADCEELTQAFAANHRLKLGVAPIPYRSLIPKGSNDIIVAGRCVAADGQALGPARIMSTCMAMGEAAGTATVLKLRDNVSYRDVNVQQLRNVLRAAGAEVDC